MQSRQLNVCWIGPASAGLEWLRNRVATFCFDQRTVQMIDVPCRQDWEAIRRACEQGADRIVLSCSDRLSYPWEQIAWLQRNCGDVPFAVATDAWWDGARRTGIGTASHLMLPWHRWWDTWVGWLAGARPELFEPYASPCAAPVERELKSVREISVGPGVVFANCRKTAAAWVQAARRLGIDADVCLPHELASGELERASSLQADWILWDDTCMDTCQGVQAESHGVSQVRELVAFMGANALLVVATSVPRFDAWEALRHVGAQEFLSKPSNGIALQSLLEHCFPVGSSFLLDRRAEANRLPKK